MSIALYNGKVLIDGSGICTSCCKTLLVLTNTLADPALTNICGVRGQDDVEWRMNESTHMYRAVYKTASILYFATRAGVRRYTTGRVFIDHIGTLNCYSIVADSSGNIYIAHERIGGATVTKLNSDGVPQWTYDHGVGSNGSAIALSYDESRIVVGGIRVNAVDTMVLLATADGADSWKRTAPGGGLGVGSLDFDDFGNIYVVWKNIATWDDKIEKYTPGGVRVWTKTSDFIRAVVTDNVNVYVARESGGMGNIWAFRCAPNPAAPIIPVLVWGHAWATYALALDSGGRLFSSSNEGKLIEHDPSDGSELWSMTPEEVWANAGNNHTFDMHAGATVVPLPWACNLAFIVGDLVLHGGHVYECIKANTSCAPVVWTAGNWTIGDRVYHPDQDESNAFILENNNKDGGDTTVPGADADWVADNEEPGVGVAWADYWQVAA